MPPTGQARSGARSTQIVVVDTETTGLGHNDRPPRPDGVVQIGYAWRNERGKVVRWGATCHPGDVFLRGGRAAEALRINGLRVEQVLSAPPAKVVATEFRERLDGIEGASGRRIELRSYNRAFDEPFLRATPWKVPAALWGPCIMQAAQDHLRHWKWPKLWEAVNMLGVQPPAGRAHTAAVDSHAALLVLEKMENRPRHRG